MAFIGNLAEFIVFILFFRLIYLLFKCIKTKDWSVFKKNGIIFLICFIITGIFTDNSSNEKNTTSKSNKTEKVSKKSSKSSLVKSSKISHNNSSKNYKSSSSLSIINEISTENKIIKTITMIQPQMMMGWTILLNKVKLLEISEHTSITLTMSMIIR